MPSQRNHQGIVTNLIPFKILNFFFYGHLIFLVVQSFATLLFIEWLDILDQLDIWVSWSGVGNAASTSWSMGPTLMLLFLLANIHGAKAYGLRKLTEWWQEREVASKWNKLRRSFASSQPEESKPDVEMSNVLELNTSQQLVQQEATSSLTQHTEPHQRFFQLSSLSDTTSTGNKKLRQLDAKQLIYEVNEERLETESVEKERARNEPFLLSPRHKLTMVKPADVILKMDQSGNEPLLLSPRDSLILVQSADVAVRKEQSRNEPLSLSPRTEVTMVDAGDVTLTKKHSILGPRHQVAVVKSADVPVQMEQSRNKPLLFCPRKKGQWFNL